MTTHLLSRSLFLLAGLALAAYPALRPYGPETGLEGARDIGSTAWLLSHSLGMVGFVALAFGLRTAALHRPSLRRTETLAWVAAALLLPYYGAETFALSEVARHASTTGDVDVMAITEAFRYAPLAMTTFGLGLLALAVVGVRLAVAHWHAGVVARTAALLVAAGLVTYLPQFFGTAEVRITHGLLLGAGLVALALSPAAQPDA